MEQSKGLEVIETKDMEVGLRYDQPWKRDPVKPVKPVKIWLNRDVNQLQTGVVEDQSGCAEFLEFKSPRSSGKLETKIKDRIGISTRIRRREINQTSILPCDQSIRIYWSRDRSRLDN